MAAESEQHPDEPETPPNAPEADEPEGNGTDLAAEVAKWRALARKHQKRAEAGAEAERRLAEIEAQGKSELEKAQEAAREWQQKAERAELGRLRAEVATRKGLTADQAKRLQGSTEEELDQDADELLEAFKPSPSQPSEPEADRATGTNGSGADRAPVPRLRPGAVPDAGAVERDPAKLAAQISRRGF